MGQKNRIETAQVGSVTVLTLFGEHDLSTQPELSAAMETSARSGARVIIDLTPTTFLDSTALGSIIYAARNADALAVVAPSGEPARLFTVAGVDQVITICSSQDEALRYLAGRTAPPAKDGEPLDVP